MRKKRCKACGNLVDHEYGHIIDNKFYCNDCITECHDCGNYILKENAIETNNGYLICEGCKSLHYFTCSECGCIMHNNYGYFHGDNETNYCPSCENKYQNPIYAYHDFDSFTKKLIYGETGTNEFFGLEIEVSGNRAYAREFLNLVPDIVLMNDRSIDGDGFEIVTEPMTRGYLLEKFLPNLEKGLNFLRNKGFRGHNKGGIHIHISQEVFSKKMLCILKNVLYSGSEIDMEVWKAITQRRQSEIDSWCKFTGARSVYEILDNSSEFPHIANDRYTAINHDCRTGTYEFRIFNSNTRIERIRKNLQTVYSLIDYAKLKEEDYSHTNTNDYIEFLKQNSIFYPDLFAFIYDMGIVQRLEEERIAA